MDYNSCVRSGASAARIVTWQDMQPHCRIDSEADQSLTEDYIDAAEELCQLYSGMSFAEQEYTVRYTDFAYTEERPGCRVRNGKMYLPISPLIFEGEIQVFYIDKTTGTEMELDDFQIEWWAKRPFIAPLPGQTWPLVQEDNINGVRIVFPAGFADTSDKRLKPYKQMIRLCVAFWYELRTPIIFDDVRKMPTPAGFDQMIINLRVE